MASSRKLHPQILALAFLIALQVICAIIFVRDVLGDLDTQDTLWHLAPEMAASACLALGIVVEALVLRALYERHRSMEQGLDVARGSLADVMSGYFQSWSLSPAEQDVAAFTIKGYSIAEIAKLRGSAEATIKAQLNAIYRKADVQGRTQLISVLVEDLFREPLAGTHTLEG
jgi:DNA-binding CsgD family transcriptional regulator